MDLPSTEDRTPADIGDWLSQPNTTKESAHQRDRRREKPQLSCTFCRRRKVRCDRELPCKTCVSKGIALSCAYTPGPQQRGSASVSERIQQLESLVRSLAHQQSIPQTSAVFSSRPIADSPTSSLRGPPGESPQSSSVCLGGITPLSSTDDETVQTSASSLPYTLLTYRKDNVTSPPPSEHGSMRMHSHGANYVSSVHWAAVLDSISELKDQYEKEEESRPLATNDYVPRHVPGPRLLYEPVHASKTDILASIPARPAVDRMVARYFNAQGIAPAILHSGQFLQEYESFWKDPTATPFVWIGLLFSVMCLSTQLQLMAENPGDATTLMRIHMFHERTVHCLVLGQYTRRREHVLETMIHHCTTEVLLCKDADIGLWVLQGVLVQLALSLGYHRDPQNFSKISPFDGEMRRRVWMAIVQMDFRLSSQMGLPRLVKSQQCDTLEPRNLFDSDFDETAVELPPSRPESEVTPVLFGLAKNKIDSASGLISDFVAETREHPYSEIMELDQKLRDAEASLPPIFRWQPLSRSFMDSPQVVLYRIWHQLAIQRLVIWLHRKYLAPSHAQERYEYSRNACVQAAIKIVEFQQLMDDETQPDGQLYSVRWMRTSLIQSLFLLGMSILCYYVQLAKSRPDIRLDRDTGARIHDLLQNTYPMWLRLSAVSRAAQEAVDHLSLTLGLQSRYEGGPLSEEATSHFTTPQDSAISLDQVTWDAYQECIASFPASFSADFMDLETPLSSSGVNFSVTDPW